MSACAGAEACARAAHLQYRERHFAAASTLAVSVVAPVMRPANVSRCLATFARQSHPNKELHLLLNNADFDLAEVRQASAGIPNVTITHMAGRPTLGAVLNQGVEQACGSFVAKMDDDDHYGTAYLSDLMIAAYFSEAEIVGKGACYMYLEGHDVTGLRAIATEQAFVKRVIGASLCVRRDVVQRVPFLPVTGGGDQLFCQDARKTGCRIFSADRFNLLAMRRRNLNSHTWKVPETRLMKRLTLATPGLSLARAML